MDALVARNAVKKADISRSELYICKNYVSCTILSC